MNIQDLITLYDYNYWGTRRIIDASAQVSDAQFIAPTSHSHGSLRRTLAHTLDTEYGWRMLCQHNVITPDMNEANFPTIAAIRERWHEEEQAMRTYLASLTDDAVAGIVRYTNEQGVQRERMLWHCLFHVVNHSTQHRSEAAAMLTDYGHSPGDVDFTIFLNEQ